MTDTVWTYQEVWKTIAEVRREQGRTRNFVGFRHMNASRVRNMVKDQLIRLKQSRTLERDDKGMPLIDNDSLQGIFDNVELRIRERAKKLGPERDNGSGENKLLFLAALREKFNEI